MLAGSADRYGQASIMDSRKLVPEGVYGRVPYRGSLADFTYQMVGGVRAAMGYCGCQTLAQLRKEARFVKISCAQVSCTPRRNAASTSRTMPANTGRV